MKIEMNEQDIRAAIALWVESGCTDLTNVGTKGVYIGYSYVNSSDPREYSYAYASVDMHMRGDK